VPVKYKAPFIPSTATVNVIQHGINHFHDLHFPCLSCILISNHFKLCCHGCCSVMCCVLLLPLSPSVAVAIYVATGSILPPCYYTTSCCFCCHWLGPIVAIYHCFIVNFKHFVISLYACAAAVIDSSFCALFVPFASSSLELFDHTEAQCSVL